MARRVCDESHTGIDGCARTDGCTCANGCARTHASPGANCDFACDLHANLPANRGFARSPHANIFAGLHGHAVANGAACATNYTAS